MTTKNIDPNVKVPAAVRRAAALADEAHQKMFGSGEPDPTVTPEGNLASAPAEPVAGDVAGTHIPEPTPASTSEPTTDSVPNLAPVEGASQPTKTIDWEHRYNSMKGRHDALQSRVSDMSAQIQSLQELVASLRAAPQPHKEETPTTPERLVTDDEENEYGSELLTVVGKKAREEILPELQKLKKQLEGVEKRVDGVNEHVSVDSRTRMHNALDHEVPNWRELNYDEKFLAWLQLPDVYSGVIRQELLSAAYERNSTPQVLAFFKGFITDEAASAPDVIEPDPAPTVPAKVPLEQFAAPGRAKTAATTVPAGKPTFTRANIASFYADVSAGKYRGREPEKDRIERQIFEAQREGRILG